MAVIDQINARVDPAVKAQYDAAAASLGCTTSELFRELLDKGLPDVVERAKAAAATRGQWPNNVPQAAVEHELQQLMKSIARSEPLAVQPRDLHGPRGKALLTLLSWVWEQSESSAAEKAARTKLAAWLAGLNIKTAVGAAPVKQEGQVDFTPPSKPVKSYPRRGTPA
jgi:hypothetical protein